jgi:hypothetical protein
VHAEEQLIPEVIVPVYVAVTMFAWAGTTADPANSPAANIQIAKRINIGS